MLINLLCWAFCPLVLFSASVSDNSPTETVVSAGPGDVVLLSCFTGGGNATTWTKDGQKVGDASTTSDGRLAVLRDGSLQIDKVKEGDEGSYLCNTSLPDSSVFQARARLQLTSKWMLESNMSDVRSDVSEP